ncbi:hypothetical protein FGIG_09506 [Fasciola gigantica]|uniref:UBA domain-containing protein n=1 Tax=Fasciola gigantica TaxID=46835 RepID=A0A504YHQ8_FASGI|nr:hypothetical protein FGIG_09506 [Fasciola gigantica]
MAVGNGMTPGSCFQPISEYGENQLGSSTSVVPGSKSLDSTGDGTMSHKSGKKTSIESAEVDALFSSDPEEAIRSVVNTTEPWGLNPVDQSTPWDLSELASETGTSTVSCGSPSAGDATNSTGSANPTAPRAPSLFDAPTNASGSARRIGPSSTSSSSSVLESNVWPSEPPNGTGIWESHYENLGERTARWQQNSTAQLVQGSGAFGTQATGAPHSHHPGFVATGSNQSGSRANLGQLQSNVDSGPSLFRGFNRPAPGLFPAAAAGANLGARPVLGTASTTHPLGASIHGAPGTGSATRSFPLNSSPGLGSSSSWSFQSGPGAPDASLNAMTGNKGRWANTGGFNRVSGKSAHNTPHLLAGQSGGSNVRWPPMGNTPHVPTGWPVNDPRRPNMMQTAGGPTGMGGSVGGVGAAASGWTNEASFFGQPNLSMMPPSRMNQPDFPSPMGLPQPRIGSSGAAGGVLPTGQQAFRTPHSAFYPTGMNPVFPPSSSISAGASAAASSVSANNQSQQQRLFLSPQQHSHQLQQQSVLRANAMRQLINMGFPEEEVQTIFSDINTSVERALSKFRVLSPVILLIPH